MDAHIEPMRDMQLTLGSAIEVEQSDALTLSAVTALADPYPLEMLEVDEIVLQGATRQQEHYIPNQEGDELLETVEHPLMGRHSDEV